MTDERDTSGSIDPEDEDDLRIPWHFWIFVVLAAAYLVFRFVQFAARGISSLL